MARFYFTYGSDSRFPYQDGWTEVDAPTLKDACTLFRLVHPWRDPDVPIGNYSDVYTEEEFQKTEMWLLGNFGKRCHEHIALTVEHPDNQLKTFLGNREDEPPEMPLLEAVCSSGEVLATRLNIHGSVLLENGIETVAQKLSLPVETESAEDETSPVVFKTVRLGGVEVVQVNDESTPEDDGT